MIKACRDKGTNTFASHFLHEKCYFARTLTYVVSDFNILEDVYLVAVYCNLKN